MLNIGLFLHISNTRGASSVSEEQTLLDNFVLKVTADGGSVENTACLLSDITFLNTNP